MAVFNIVLLVVCCFAVVLAQTTNSTNSETSAATTPASGASTASTGTTQSTPNTTKNGSSFNTPLASVILTSVAVIFFQMSHTFLFAK
ncbi:hypothetical protein BsWGS_19616 [Bradybaena similaris]